jgi:hypothetical protein
MVPCLSKWLSKGQAAIEGNKHGDEAQEKIHHLEV